MAHRRPELPTLATPRAAFPLTPRFAFRHYGRFSAPLSAVPARDSSPELHQRLGGFRRKWQELVDTAVTNLGHPRRVDEQRPSDRDEVDFAVAPHPPEGIESCRLACLALDQTSHEIVVEANRADGDDRLSGQGFRPACPGWRGAGETPFP